MSSTPGIFIRDYHDYLEKKRAGSSFCKNSNVNDPFCSQISTQGQYLLFKTNLTPCFWVRPVCIPKQTTDYAACKLLNTLYDGVTNTSITDLNS